MTLKPSFYDGGKRKKICEVCGTFLHNRVGKCSKCAQDIADKVTKDFYENIGHHMTEAVLATGDEKLISSIVEGAKAIEDKKNEEP